MKRIIVIIPLDGFRLYGAIVRKEVELAKKGKGTWYRSAGKEKDKAKWSHAKYKGWVNMQRGAGETITAVIQSRSETGDHWQILQSFLGFLDRNFSENISSITVQYRD